VSEFRVEVVIETREDSGRSLRFFPQPEQDTESEFWINSVTGAGVKISSFTEGELLLLSKLCFHWQANFRSTLLALYSLARQERVERDLVQVTTCDSISWF